MFQSLCATFFNNIIYWNCPPETEATGFIANNMKK